MTRSNDFIELTLFHNRERILVNVGRAEIIRPEIKNGKGCTLIGFSNGSSGIVVAESYLDIKRLMS